MLNGFIWNYIPFRKHCRSRSAGFGKNSWSGPALFPTMLVRKCWKLENCFLTNLAAWTWSRTSQQISWWCLTAAVKLNPLENCMKDVNNFWKRCKYSYRAMSKHLETIFSRSLLFACHERSILFWPEYFFYRNAIFK